jgi:hypothetical protein
MAKAPMQYIYVALRGLPPTALPIFDEQNNKQQGCLHGHPSFMVLLFKITPFLFIISFVQWAGIYVRQKPPFYMGSSCLLYAFFVVNVHH